MSYCFINNYYLQQNNSYFFSIVLVFAYPKDKELLVADTFKFSSN